ncbi:MAG: class C sortase [Clostridiales Family XIII bacterium]|jgi:sortase A|nr:class C sortase [Clostridiales Family XIII bacterium]
MLKKFFIFIFVIAGVALLSYPWFSNWYASRGHQEVINQYQEQAKARDAERISEEIRLAEAYNSSLSGDAVTDPFVLGSGTAVPGGYESILDPDGTGVMAVLMIPKINLKLPVYHGVSESVLERGIGHMMTTAFPVGGPGTHCVVAGHRGLPSQELFTRLDVLDIGDEFFFDVMGQMRAYRVDDISVVLPDQTDSLKPVPGEDYVTLTTCTPLGVNSHRLLIRGARIPYVEGLEQQIPLGAPLSKSEIQLIIGATIAAITMGIAIIFAAKRRKKSQ